jgi:hypothetical protein
VERGFRVAGKSRKELRAQAISLRSQLRIREPWFPIVELLDVYLGQYFPHFVFDVVEKDELGPQHGVTTPDEFKIEVREDVYLGALAGHGRDRFTLAHELGHLLNHRGVTLSRTRFDRRKPHPPFEDSEWQANTFASELLIPIEAARLHPGNEFRLAELCGVSADAAITRLKILRGEGLLK